MGDININGVGLNADAVIKMGKEKFIAHPMHQNHWLHLDREKRALAIIEAWDIIFSASGQHFNIDDYGIDNRTTGKVSVDEGKPSGNKGRKRAADKGGIPKP